MKQLGAELEPLWKSVLSAFPGDLRNDDPRPYLLKHVEEGHPAFIKANQQSAAAVTACIFGALSAESYINWYASRHLGGKYLGEVDKLSPLGKWLAVPRMVSKDNKGLRTDGQAYELASNLFTLRNLLVHDKPKPAHLVDPRNDLLETFKGTPTARQRAAKAKPTETVQRLLTELNEIDSSVDTSWTLREPQAWEVY